VRYVTAAVVITLSASLAAHNREPRFEVVSIEPHTGPPTTSIPPRCALS
jgi:hypothetical protein